MERLIEFLSNNSMLLSNSCSNSQIPMYSSYIHFCGDSIVACNGKIYTELFIETPFTGAVDTKTLLGVLKNSPTSMVYKKNSLVLKGNTFKSILPVFDIQVPRLNPETEYEPITEEFVYSLLLSQGFIGTDSYQYICVNQSAIISTNMEKVFCSFYTPSKSFLLSKEYLYFFKLGEEFGITDNLIVVKYEDGFSALAIPKQLEQYPGDKVLSFVNELNKDNLSYICQMKELNSAVVQLSPVLIGENRPAVQLKCSNKNLSIVAETVNGFMSSNIITEADMEFDFAIDKTIFHGIPDEFNVYINPEYTDKLVIKDSSNKIIIILKGGSLD